MFFVVNCVEISGCFGCSEIADCFACLDVTEE